MKNMEDVYKARELTALSKCVPDSLVKGCRGDLQPGSFDVDMKVHIRGSVTVGNDTTYVPTVDVPMKSTLALFMRYCGCTRDAAKSALLRAMREAIDEKQSADEKNDAIIAAISEDEKIINDVMDQVQSMLAELPKKLRKGSVRAKLKYELI